MDASYENSDFHVEVTEKVLKEIGAGSKAKIKALNKVDLVGDRNTLEVNSTGKDSFLISAKYDTGVDELMSEIMKRIFGEMIETKLLIPYTRGDISSYIQNKGEVKNIEYTGEGTLMECSLKEEVYNRFKEFEVL